MIRVALSALVPEDSQWGTFRLPLSFASLNPRSTINVERFWLTTRKLGGPSRRRLLALSYRVLVYAETRCARFRRLPVARRIRVRSIP